MSNPKKPAADDPETLRTDQGIEGARLIRARLETIRDNYAADLGAERAAKWHDEVLLYLHEAES